MRFMDPTKPNKVNGIVSAYRFCRVPFGMICSPFLLEGTLKFHRKKEGIYVDNTYLCIGTNSVEETLSLFEESKSIIF